MDRAQKVFEDAVRAEEAGHSAEALRLYEKASVIDPDAAHAQLRWAALLHFEGRWEDSIRIARQLTRRRPRIYLAHRLIGSNFVELKRWQMAERFFNDPWQLSKIPLHGCYLATYSAASDGRRNQKSVSAKPSRSIPTMRKPTTISAACTS
jgi:tetratricopeptide (TPR) repeat protein